MTSPSNRQPVADCHVHLFDSARFPYRQDTVHLPKAHETATAEQLLAVLGAHAVTHAPLVTLEGRKTELVGLDYAAIYDSAFEGALRHFVERPADGKLFETEAADNLEVLGLVDEVYSISNP